MRQCGQPGADRVQLSPAAGAANVAYIQSGVPSAPSNAFPSGYVGGSVAPRIFVKVAKQTHLVDMSYKTAADVEPEDS